jgi:arylsulfatase A-like enzyme
MNQPTRREFLVSAGMATLAAAVSGATATRAETTGMGKPNFIIFFTDDQGYGDLSFMGATDFRTPHLDALAASGAHFTNWYANAPVCAPSRVSLLTGRYPGNAGLRGNPGGHRTAPGLPTAVPTLADALKQEGYRTGLTGKWHLGAAEACRPHHRGFDEWFGFLSGCVDFYSHIFYWQMAGGRDPVHDLWENGDEIWRNGEYLTDLITEYATQFIRESAQHDAPFFLCVPYNAPHYPMHAPKEHMDRFAHLPWDRQVMAAMVSAVDDSVGAIMAELKRQDLYENTCVFFASDHGPSRETRNWLDGTTDPYYGGQSGQFKGHKFSLYEGGIRVPAILSWPARIPAGQVVDEVGMTMDIFPTFVQAAGGSLEGYELDGKDVLPMAAEGGASPHDMIFWEQHKQTAVRKGPWKLVLNGELVDGAPPEDAVHLANLEQDPGERTNLRNQHPEMLQELQTAAEQWRAAIDRRWETEWKPKQE